MIDESAVREIVEKVLLQLTGECEVEIKLKVKVNASNRHVHICREHLDILFGKGYELTKVRDLIQPGEFASDEFVTLAGPKGSFSKVRILGPVRNYTQVEVSVSDTFVLGVKDVCLRDSGSHEGTCGITLVGPKGSVALEKGLILAHRHVHMTPEDAKPFGIEDGQFVSVRVDGPRALVFEKVLARVKPSYALEMHVDIDEANAAMVGSDTWGEILV